MDYALKDFLYKLYLQFPRYHTSKLILPQKIFLEILFG